MTGITDDPSDPRLKRGVDSAAGPQNEVYLVLSEAERAQGFVRPYRDRYVHDKGCGALTSMGRALSETYARNPAFYGSTYCVGCGMHKRVGAEGEFVWEGTTERVGT